MLRDARVRVQRLRDAKFFSGWLEQLDHHHAAVSLNGTARIDAGEAVFVEIYGPGQRITFPAVVGPSNGRSLVVFPTKPAVIVPASEGIRVRNDKIRVSLALGSSLLVGQSIDISPGGLAARFPEPVKKDSRVDLTLSAPEFRIRSEARVAYCRPLEDEAAFRCGLAFLHMPRIDRALWLRQFEAEDFPTPSVANG